jgi:phage-related protein (TIGR01555 family)
MGKGRRKIAEAAARQAVMEFIAQSKPRRAPAKRQAKPKAAESAPAPPQRKPWKITPDIVAASKQRYPRANPFTIPHFPTAVMDHVPQDRRMAMDEAVSSINAWAGGAWNSFGLNAAFEGVTFLGYPYLAELAQRPEYRVIVETVATEMTRKWIRIEAKGDSDKSRQIARLTEELERLQVRERFGQVCELDGYFGRAHLYIDTGHTDDRQELMTPIGNGINAISKEKIGKGSIKRLAVVEPIWCYPSSYNSNNPLKPDWYNPQRWFAMGSELHTSRLLPFVGREVPDILKPAYAFGGLSLTQLAKPYVENWLNTRQSVADIIQAFSVMVLKTNLGETLTPGGDQLFARADLFNNTRDNRGLMMIDKEAEEFANVSAPLGTLDALQAQTQEHMASVSRIPLVKLLGISPHGLNATAEPELRAFYDTIHAFQAKFFTPNLKRIFAMAQLNIWGRVDPDLSFVYEPLWSMTEKEEAEIRKLDAETGQIHVDTGVLSPEEERGRIANDPSTRYPGIDPDDVPDLKEEEEEGLEPKGSAEKLADETGDDDQAAEA